MRTAEPLATPSDVFERLYYSRIVVLPQVRAARVDPHSVADLVDAIEESGVIVPPWVRAEGDRRILVAGHRRIEAVGVLVGRGAHSGYVDCQLVRGDHYDLQLAENSARKKTNLLDVGRYVAFQMQEGRQLDSLVSPSGYSARTLKRALRVHRNLCEAWREIATRVELKATLLIYLSTLSVEKQEKELVKWRANPDGKNVAKGAVGRGKSKQPAVFLGRVAQAHRLRDQMPPIVRRYHQWLTSRGGRRPSFLE